MICVIDVIGGPAKGKRVWIRENEQLQIGRHSTANLSIPSDPHLSRRHLLIEGVGGKFRARDLGSANGTFVNRAGISTVELLDGDHLQVGTTVLLLSLIPEGTNPHSKDGISFDSANSPLLQDYVGEDSATQRLGHSDLAEDESKEQDSKDNNL